jgi:hypothetical protein
MIHRKCASRQRAKQQRRDEYRSHDRSLISSREPLL